MNQESSATQAGATQRFVPVQTEAPEPDRAPSQELPAKGMPSGPRTVTDREGAAATGAVDMPGQRVAFVLRRKGQGDTPVFADGGSGGREAVAVFSARERAVLYLQVARWDDYELADLSPRQFGAFLRSVQGQGIKHAMVDPNRREQERGVEQPLLHLERTADQTGENLYEEVLTIGQNRTASTHA